MASIAMFNYRSAKFEFNHYFSEKVAIFGVYIFLVLLWDKRTVGRTDFCTCVCTSQISQYQASAHGGTKGSQRDPISQAPGWRLKDGNPRDFSSASRNFDQSFNMSQDLSLNDCHIAQGCDGSSPAKHGCQWAALLSLSKFHFNDLRWSQNDGFVFYFLFSCHKHPK